MSGASGTRDADGLLARLLGRRDEQNASVPEKIGAIDGEAASSGTDRRHRKAETAADRVIDVIGQKILLGWLQNRNQTFMPLSVNFARLDRDDVTRLVRFGGVAATAGGDDTAPARVRAWLASAGVDEAGLASFSDALACPPPLSTCLDELSRSDSAALAFVLAMVAAREGGTASRLFADYVAARLALPNAAIRSAERRYRA